MASSVQPLPEETIEMNDKKQLIPLLMLILGLAPNIRSEIKSYDKGRMGGSSMGGQFPFEGAFFSKDRLADQPMPSQATKRVVKFAFRAELGWYAIAYYPKDRPKSFMKEYGRFTATSVDKEKNSYVITLYDPDYQGEFIERVPNPSNPKDLSGKKEVATIELKIQGDELAVMVKSADSKLVSFAGGDIFQIAVKKEKKKSES